MTNFITQKVAIACDHAGSALKQKIIAELKNMHADVEIIDFGTDGKESVDYPDYAQKVAVAIISGEAEMGVLICGTGIGISIAANRYKEIRAALCYNSQAAELTRAHNDANILALGARMVSDDEALDCVRKFFTTEFEGGRHADRIKKMS